MENPAIAVNIERKQTVPVVARGMAAVMAHAVWLIAVIPMFAHLVSNVPRGRLVRNFEIFLAVRQPK